MNALSSENSSILASYLHTYQADFDVEFVIRQFSDFRITWYSSCLTGYFEELGFYILNNFLLFFFCEIGIFLLDCVADKTI